MAKVMEEVVEEQEVEVEVADMVMDEVEDMEREDKQTVDITMMDRGTLTTSPTKSLRIFPQNTKQ